MAYFLFFFYLFSGTILLHLIIRRTIYPFTIYHTLSVVCFKVFMGCLYGWVFLHFYGGDDTWNYFNESKDQTHLLLQHPLQFFQEFLPSFSLKATDHQGWKAVEFYIIHFERWFLIKGLALLNLFSGKNYYVDVVLFEFLTIAGPLLLFKLMARQFPKRTGMHFLLIFFIPSIIFWCSGIRAEALLLLGMVLMIYNGLAYTRHRRGFHALGILAGMALLLLVRYQFLIIFLPAYGAFLYSIWKKDSGPVYFFRVYTVCILVFISSLYLPPAWQLSRPLQQAQQKFYILKGNTRYALDSLQPGPVSFLKILPQAVANSSLRPWPWEGKSLLQSVSAVEVLLLVAGLLYSLTGPERKKQVSHPLYWLFLFYGISQLIGIGYTVPFPGAIVRYRSIPFLMLFLFFYAGNPLVQRKLSSWIFKLHYNKP
jgi:hypothetical protein